MKASPRTPRCPPPRTLPSWHPIPRLRPAPPAFATRFLHCSRPLGNDESDPPSPPRPLLPGVRPSTESSTTSPAGNPQDASERLNPPSPPAIPSSVRRKLPLPGSDSVLVRPFEPLPHPKETLRNFNAHFGSWKRQDMLRQEKEAWRLRYLPHASPEPDWRKVLRILRNKTPARPPGGPWTANSHAVKLSPKASAVLLNDVDDNIWVAYDVTDCQIDVAPARDPAEEFELVLSGDRVSVDACWKMLLDICARRHLGTPTITELPREEDGAVSDPRQNPVTEAEPPIKRHYDEHSKYSGRPFEERGPPLYVDRLEDVPAPAGQWTRRLFCTYLNRLSRARLPAECRAGGFGDVQRSLGFIFKAVYRRAAEDVALSTTGFLLGLRLAVQYQWPWSSLEALLEEFQTEYKFRPDARAWNVLLQAVRQNHDLIHFTTVVSDMTRDWNGVTPNQHTWQVFLQLIENVDAKNEIISVMMAKGMLGERRTMRIVAEEVALSRTLEAARTGRSLAGFLETQRESFGWSWISPGCLNQMVEGLGCYGRFDDCLQLVDYVLSPRSPQPCRPSTATFQIIMNHARLQSAPRALIDALLALERFDPGLASSAISGQLLFFALRERYPGLLGQLWIAACHLGTLGQAAMAKLAPVFGWLVASAAGSPEARPPKITIHSDSALFPLDTGPIIVPTLFRDLAAIALKSAEPGEDAAPLWKDGKKLVELFISLTRETIPVPWPRPGRGQIRTPVKIGRILAEVLENDLETRKTWRADPSPENQRVLDITPVGRLEMPCATDPGDSESDEFTDDSFDVRAVRDAFSRQADAGDET